MVQGLIHDIPTVAELVSRIVADAEAIMTRRMGAMLAAPAVAEPAPAGKLLTNRVVRPICRSAGGVDPRPADIRTPWQACLAVVSDCPIPL
jgi:hypothetical protein